MKGAKEAGVEVIVRSGRTLWDSDELVKKNHGKPTRVAARSRDCLQCKELAMAVLHRVLRAVLPLLLPYSVSPEVGQKWRFCQEIRARIAEAG